MKFHASPSNQINPWKNKARLGDFFCHNDYYISRKRKSTPDLFFGFGIRRSDMIQIFPVWLKKNSWQKSVMLGVWKFYLEIGYSH